MVRIFGLPAEIYSKKCTCVVWEWVGFTWLFLSLPTPNLDKDGYLLGLV